MSLAVPCLYVISVTLICRDLAKRGVKINLFGSPNWREILLGSIDRMEVLVGAWAPKVAFAVVILIGGWLVARLGYLVVHRGECTDCAADRVLAVPVAEHPEEHKHRSVELALAVPLAADSHTLAQAAAE